MGTKIGDYKGFTITYVSGRLHKFYAYDKENTEIANSETEVDLYTTLDRHLRSSFDRLEAVEISSDRIVAITSRVPDEDNVVWISYADTNGSHRSKALTSSKGWGSDPRQPYCFAQVTQANRAILDKIIEKQKVIQKTEDEISQLRKDYSDLITEETLDQRTKTVGEKK